MFSGLEIFVIAPVVPSSISAVLNESSSLNKAASGARVKIVHRPTSTDHPTPLSSLVMTVLTLLRNMKR